MRYSTEYATERRRFARTPDVGRRGPPTKPIDLKTDIKYKSTTVYAPIRPSARVRRAPGRLALDSAPRTDRRAGGERRAPIPKGGRRGLLRDIVGHDERW